MTTLAKWVTAFLFTATSLIASMAAADAPRTEPREGDAPRRPPNFVLILCDNLGYGDVGCFNSGAKQRTPRIDQLAAEGMKFTDCYAAAPVCTPSRAALMTGCYPRRVGLDQTASDGHVLRPISRHGLHPGEITIAEILKARGYATAKPVTKPSTSRTKSTKTPWTTSRINSTRSSKRKSIPPPTTSSDTPSATSSSATHSTGPTPKASAALS